MSGNIYHKHHHQKRQTRKKQTVPSDNWIYAAVIAGPLMTLPQVYDIWVANTNGLSLVTWCSYIVIACLWLAYGIKHRDQPIIAVQTIWIILDIVIVAGIVLV